MFELGTIELQVPIGDIVSVIADETIAVLNRVSIHKRRKTYYLLR